MGVYISKNWENYFLGDGNEGLGSAYERIIINNKILEICDKYQIKSILEAPSFGFTGVTGINSVEMARNGLDITLAEKDCNKLKYIQNTWENLSLNCKFLSVLRYDSLPVDYKSIDMSWNFSAIWFVENLESFLKEIDRITRKKILICVPNMKGFGYILLKNMYKKQFSKILKEDFAKHKNIIAVMNNLGWNLEENGYLDCPPWPDICMSKEEFLSKFKLGFLLSSKKKDVPYYSILDYYKGKDEYFMKKVSKYFWFEKVAPNLIKKFWAHHRYFLFTK